MTPSKFRATRPSSRKIRGLSRSADNVQIIKLNMWSIPRVHVSFGHCMLTSLLRSPSFFCWKASHLVLSRPPCIAIHKSGFLSPGRGLSYGGSSVVTPSLMCFMLWADRCPPGQDHSTLSSP